MINKFIDFIDKFEKPTKNRFQELHRIVMNSTLNKPEEILWAKLPSFYIGNNFVRIIPFKDHINIEAKAIIVYKDELTEYKITPKGMLQIFHNQPIPIEMLEKIIKDSLMP